MSTTEDGVEVEIVIDRDLCIGAQNCVHDLPAVFRIDDEGLAVTIDGGRASLAALLAVVLECPTDAIRVLRSHSS